MKITRLFLVCAILLGAIFLPSYGASINQKTLIQSCENVPSLSLTSIDKKVQLLKGCNDCGIHSKVLPFSLDEKCPIDNFEEEEVTSSSLLSGQAFLVQRKFIPLVEISCAGPAFKTKTPIFIFTRKLII